MATTEEDLPFKAEYAKTGRASCKMCKSPIEKDSLRLAAMVQSSFFDGRQPNWFHERCFFKKQRPASEGDIANFENVRYEDQKRIKTQIAALGAGAVVAASGKGQKRTKGNAEAKKDFGVEYSKSARATCAGCQLKITKEDVRVKKVVYDTEVGMKFGGQALWHHLECFAQVRNDLGWLEKGEALPGFKSLSAEDQKKVKTLLPALKSEDYPDAKKAKLEAKEDPEEKELEAKIAKQSKVLFDYRDKIQKQKMTKPAMLTLLEDNNQVAPGGDSGKLLNMVCDVLAFGALKSCTKCKGGQYVFNKSGYICTGDLTEWTKCANFEKEPARVACVVNEDLRNDYPFLKKYKSRVQARAIKYVAPSAPPAALGTVKKEDELDGPKVKREKPTLYGLQFAIIGLKGKEEKIKKEIYKLGGNVVSKMVEHLAAVISDEDSLERMSGRMEQAKDLGIQVVTEDFLDAVKDDPSGAVSYITSKSICDWGTDPHARIPQEDSNKSKSKSIYTKSVPKTKKLKLKGGIAVDPDSGLDDVAHVYANGKEVWNAILGLVDLQRKKNSFYKLQVLQKDNGNKFWLFRSWGRIGTTIGGNKVDSCSSLGQAQTMFRSLYEEKSGNSWESRDYFQKLPGKMYPIDIDYGADEEKILGLQESKIKSKLHEQVQNLISLIFDVNLMKKAMLEFDLDMEKMPLGKLSQKQLQAAYKVLSEISEHVKKGGSEAHFIDCTNRFYTLIPHSFGVDNPPILNTVEQVARHSEVLDALMEIECAYSMLQSEDAKENLNPLDQHYEQLKTDLVPVDKDSEEFKLLEKYVQNTHAETHRMYELEIVDIFKVARKGEERRYKPFKKLHNRKLLWHGSRLTNYAGILSHGLKIAPPEAPPSGYMFGKGIYFADMVSKSANYCFTSKNSSTGLLLLSEVALGDMMECTQAKYVTKLPKDKHSTKGIGKTQPNPKESHMRDDGVEIPLGKPITSDINTSLLYNEFIVYDVSQVNVQYLFRLNFNYKY